MNRHAAPGGTEVTRYMTWVKNALTRLVRSTQRYPADRRDRVRAKGPASPGSVAADIGNCGPILARGC
jgi:hypothetical protein